MLIETVRVKSDDTEMGYVIINQSDFNATVHVVFDDAPAPEASAKEAKSGTKTTSK